MQSESKHERITGRKHRAKKSVKTHESEKKKKKEKEKASTAQRARERERKRMNNDICIWTDAKWDPRGVVVFQACKAVESKLDMIAVGEERERERLKFNGIHGYFAKSQNASSPFGIKFCSSVWHTLCGSIVHTCYADKFAFFFTAIE